MSMAAASAGSVAAAAISGVINKHGGGLGSGIIGNSGMAANVDGVALAAGVASSGALIGGAGGLISHHRRRLSASDGISSQS